MNRRGFTLTELIMTLSVTALMGVALTRILISDSRFISRQDAMLTARQGARAALNSILSEISMVTDTVVFAARDSFQVRIPVAFGVTCRAPGGGTTRIVSFLPVDSVAWASLDTTGVSWRPRTGGYRRLNPSSIAVTTSGSDSSLCRSDSVRMLAGGKLIRLSGLSSTMPCSNYNAIPPIFSPSGTCQPDSLAIAMLYSRVTYKFAASTDLPGRIGLWRKNWLSAAEELVAPFDTSARFAYLMGGPNSATLALRTSAIVGSCPGTACATLDSVRGVELRLYAASEKSAQGTSSPQTFKLRTQVRFVNR